jgi:hypothetical protein
MQSTGTIALAGLTKKRCGGPECDIMKETLSTRPGERSR